MSTTTLLYGDLRTGRIIDTLDVTACPWEQVNNDAGRIGGATVEAHEVRKKSLRIAAAAARTFLAVDVDGRLQEAGPIWSRSWDDQAQQLTLGAAGLWSLFDHRKVVQVLAAGLTVTKGGDLGSITYNGADLGDLARQLVALAMSHVGGDLPLVLPAARPGSARTETFDGFQLLKLGDQLRQLTTRQSGAPDIRFRADYTTDKLGVQWFLETGTEDAPLLTQAGQDWYFDQTVSKPTVININTDEDGTQMGMRGWITGSGSEEDTPMATAYDPTLVDLGWPLLEVDESHTDATEQDTLDGYAQALVDQRARPVEAWKVVTTAEAAREVLAGHYARVIPKKNHAWLPPGETFLRVASKAGDLTDRVTLTMYPILDPVL